MIRYLLLFFLSLMGSLLFSQNQIKVIHANTKAPIEKAAVYCNDILLGHTPKDGTLTFKTTCKTIEVEADFFEGKTVKVSKEFVVTLAPSSEKTKNIHKVIIKNESDPRAMNVLKQVNKNYQKNSPKSLNGYRFKKYSKISLDLDKDTIDIYRDFLIRRQDSLVKYSIPKAKQSEKEVKDSLMSEGFSNIGKESNFFLWEKAEEYKFSKNLGEKIVILDSKISGFKNPIYEFMAMNISNLNRLPRQVNPDNYHLYRYFLSDTLEIDGRKNFVIKFRQLDSKQKQNPRKFTGNIYIDTETFAIKKIESNSKKQNEGNIISVWKLIDGKWFLDTEDIKFRMGSQSFDTGKTITDPETKKKKTPQKKFGSYVFVKNRFFDFDTHPTQNSKEFQGYTYSIEHADGQKLAQYRTEELTERESKTYNSVDSISKVYDFEQKLAVLTTLMRGKIRWGKVDFLPEKIIKYNTVEGFRLGIGVKTNERFSTLFSPDAYIGYGFKDKKIKYGVGIDFKLSNHKNSVLRGEVYNDIEAFGAFNKTLWQPDMLLQNLGGDFYNRNFFRYKGVTISYEYDLLNSLTAKISVSRQNQNSANDYQFKGQENNYVDFSTKLSLKYAPKDKNIMTPQGKFTYETGSPIFFANIEKGTNLLGGNMEYYRADAMARHRFRTKLGTTIATLYGGISSHTAPLWKNFEIAGNTSATKHDFWSQINLESALTHYTMPAGTFYAEHFAGIQLRHTLPFTFKMGSRFSRITLGYNAVWGDFKYKHLHTLPFNTPKYIYQEAGVTWRNFMGTRYDIGLYHRLGHYTSKMFTDNIGVAIGFGL